MVDQPSSSNIIATFEPTSQAGISRQANRTPKYGNDSGRARAQVACKFFAKGECRAGSSCPFLHGPKGISSAEHEDHTNEEHQAASDQDLEAPTRRFQAPAVVSSKIVQRPVPRTQQQDPRIFQIEQLKKRFNPLEVNLTNQTTLTFKLAPSDPDFPFDLNSGLQCILLIPSAYPAERPSLRITNKEMGRGFQINVEKGFAELALQSRTSTLLGLLNQLDRQLESLLSGKEAETIKIVKNIAPRSEQLPELEQPPPSPPLQPQIRPSRPLHTTQQLNDAESKRKAEVRQLEARLGRQPRFEKTTDGLSYMLPIEPRRRQDLPVPLQNVNTIELTVPQLYPLDPCTIRLFGTQPAAAENTELAFVQYIKKQVKDGKPGNLLGYVNYLSSNMHILATTHIDKEEVQSITPIEELTPENSKPTNVVNTDSTQPDHGSLVDEDRPHVHYVQRPPEWDVQFESSDESYSDESDGSENLSDDETAQEDENGQEPTDADGPERGIMLSFPFLELHGIEILELVSLAVTLRCTRCKDTLDVERLRLDAPKIETCKKCGQGFGVGFRRELMHLNSVRAGYLDLNGCTIVDMLPSRFIPTCAECSTAQAAPGIVSVRSQSAMTICRECHHRMSFNIPEVKFLQISAATSTKYRPPPRRKVKESLGVTAGTELPNRGRCEHYRKSYRWFRFSCCQKVFPCDKCHDHVSDHLTEFANRMLCGWCSREQIYRPETCAFCRNNVTGKRGGGFWEGGKGTRDKNLMSRKDPRKFKRRQGVNAKVGGSSSKR